MGILLVSVGETVEFVRLAYRSAKLMVVLRRELEIDKRQIRQYRLLKNVMNKVSSARQIDK